MATETAGYTSVSGAAWHGRLADIFAGSVCSVLSLAYALSYAALIFAGPLAPLLDHGVMISFASTAVLAAAIALTSSIPVMIGGPDSSVSAVIAALGAALVDHVLRATPGANALPTMIVALTVVSALTGAFVWLLGRIGGGRAIRYVPYPVIGGFLGATGALILLGAVRVITGEAPRFDLTQWQALGSDLRLWLGIGVALLITLVMRFLRKPPALPLLLVAGALLAHLGFHLAGLSLADAQAEGWTFAAHNAPFTMPWHVAGQVTLPTDHLLTLAGDTLAVVLVATIATMVNVTGIEAALMREADVERELRSTGVANLAVALIGGLPGCASTSRTILAQAAGARTRLAGLTVAVIATIVVATDPAIMGYLPRFVLGGLLLYVGAGQLHRWLIVSWQRLSRIEYLALVAIIVITVKLGFIWGLVLGTVIGCATFAMSASRVNSIKFEFDASELRSSLDRDPADLAILTAHGRELLGLNLQSYLFFGSANRLYRHVKAMLAAAPQCRFMVFDFRLVTGIDSSATYSFLQIRNYASERGIRLVFVNLAAATEKALRVEAALMTEVQVFDELDHALEWCENEIIRAHRAEALEEGDLHDWFARVLGRREDADTLLHLCRRIEVAPGVVIARAGETARSMYFILSGRIGVTIATGPGRSLRVRSLGRHTMVGEMGLLAGQPRSATLQAEIDSVLYELDADAFARLRTQHPALVDRLLSYVIAVMAERLAFANRSIGVLRR